MESKLNRIVKTFTFRLALVYVGLFSLSVVVLFAFIYTFAVRYLDAETSDEVRRQYADLSSEYRARGSSAVEKRIRELIKNDDDGTGIYLLVNREGEKLAGNLNEWPAAAAHQETFEKDGSWVHFQIEAAATEAGIPVKAAMAPLSDWRSLLVGRSLQNNERIEQTIVQTFWASLLLTLAMAFIGAIVMTRSVMGRLSIINRSAGAIMHGHISTRIPFTQGGDEFDELSSNLNQMLDRIERLLLSLSQFASNIAHDLRSPLNRIINRLDAGLRAIEPANPARKLLEQNILDMEELVGTFNSILRISELEANTGVPDFEPCDLSVVIGKLVEFYEPYAAGKNIRLESDVSPLLIRGEKNLLTQMFANLLDNAVKFTPEGGRIEVSCRNEGNDVTVVIADNGPGVPPEYRGKVFEKFFRLEQSRHTRGNGLGLSMVAAVARIHGAGISLEDNAPGLRVRISFPYSEQM